MKIYIENVFEYSNSLAMVIPPLKSTDTTKNISISVWFKSDSVTGNHVILSKYNTATSARSLWIATVGNDLTVYLGYNSPFYHMHPSP